MVKAFIKGGVWKNSEDEILKAAVMKYGKQQWARVASLLNRKSAKQCKARWHEWLDPSVKKVEWSRAEEEKLLHLAKLLPAQWKTIEPLVGRTASQVQEHYEKLLDEAAGGTEARSATLQVGQIDAHPETKPARPDPIDMDEDEMEMLQEARARLANTQGKKAKRKARERLLNQAKRLADLQKRRELKQAGLLSGAAKKKAGRMRNKDIDLGVEIPFHKPAPAGFHDVSDEAEKTEQIRQKRLKSVDYHQVNENQYRSRDREAAQAQAREEARLKALEKSNMQYVVAQVSKQNDPLNISRKRGILELPTPQVSDKELSQIRKLQQEQENAARLAAAGTGHAATQALLGDYTDRPLPTPMRTPAQQPNQVKDLMRQASELRQLEQGQTPLLAGLQSSGDGDTDGIQEDAAVKATPMMPPPSNRRSSQTPLRDELGLNPDDVSVVSGFTSAGPTTIRDLARQERRAAKRARQALEEALAALPAPQFEYELATPENQPDVDDMQVETIYEPDMADMEAADRERRREEAERLYKARNSVLKRSDLPRPSGPIPDVRVTAENDAAALVEMELMKLLKHDDRAYPVVELDGKKKSKKRKKDANTQDVILDILSEEVLDSARELLQVESDLLVQETIRKAKEFNGPGFISENTILHAMAKAAAEVSREGAANLFYQGDAGFVENGDELEALKEEFQTIREATMALRKKNDKIAAKLSIKNGGYNMRAKTLNEEMLQNFALQQNHKIERAVFESLASMEARGATQRIESLQNELADLESQESILQKQYGDLLLEKKRIAASLKSSA
ncbi:Cell division [Fragilaria crotonensis]|nr:Cell division [Fragilaria crotonensis]